MKLKMLMGYFAICLTWPWIATSADAAEPELVSELVFPLNPKHNHAPGIVECPNGDLFASWYRGAGERQADDVAVFAAWKKRGAAVWTEPFVLADTPGFPDCNTALFIDRDKQLWLFYPTILANSWESCLTNFKIAKHFDAPESPSWTREGMILLKPDDRDASPRSYPVVVFYCHFMRIRFPFR